MPPISPPTRGARVDGALSLCEGVPEEALLSDEYDDASSSPVYLRGHDQQRLEDDEEFVVTRMNG